ncbi:MAG: hypothetical protein KBC35_00550 [Candidatus Pacebacteria bacterium]|nr:hypothetical protein [Candidatus Paceibacterota bacterium]
MTLHKILPWLAVIISIAAAAYVTFYFSTAQATYSRAVGDISALFIPNEGTGTEYVELSFSGVLGKESMSNLTGWKLSNGAGFEFSLSDIVLSSAASVRICEAEAEAKADPACDYFFTESNIFDNDQGSLIIKDGAGVVVLEESYVTAAFGMVIRVPRELNYYEDVYTTGNKVTICQKQKDGAFKLRKMNALSLAREMNDAILRGVDIVPSFIYEADKTLLGYHPGVNWPAGKSVWEGGCQ